MRKLFLLELNELNFDLVWKYIDKGVSLPGFERLRSDFTIRRTSSETEYENLEPWIQWPSVHTGKAFQDHKIFRLGDVVNYSGRQVFEELEDRGVRVGCISPMNAVNNMSSPCYFVPDPWTATKSDGSLISRLLTDALKQSVNDNAKSKLTVKTVASLIFCCFCLVRPTRLPKLIYSGFCSLGRPWRRALFLDELLWEFHAQLFKRRRADFTVLFLNAGAHIQHHYLLNSPFVETKAPNPSWYVKSKEDPFLEMLRRYDKMLSDLPGDSEVIIATGLTQKPFSDPVFYYRLRNHSAFLNKLGIPHVEVKPRMTRDFLVVFQSTSEAKRAKEILESCIVDGNYRCFEEVEHRGCELFVILTFPHEVSSSTILTVENKEIKLHEHVSFVAIKNGEHDGEGYCFTSNNIDINDFEDKAHISTLYKVISTFFHTSESQGS